MRPMKPRPFNLTCPNDDGSGARVYFPELPVGEAAERWRGLNIALGKCRCGAGTALAIPARRTCRHCGSDEHNARTCPVAPPRRAYA